MTWLDYREALGIGFEDEEKETFFLNKLIILCDTLREACYSCEQMVCSIFFAEICELPKRHYSWYEISLNMRQESGFLGVLSKAVAFANSFYKADQATLGRHIEDNILQALDDLKIPYEIKRDDQGMFIFPKGAEELDEMNVNVPFEWLQDYPEARHAMAQALKAYSDSEDYSTTADLFRKALECFMQSFFNSEKSLENLKSEYGQFMKDQGIPTELVGNFETVLQMYTNYMNNFAKHHDKTEKRYLEFIMYHTGNIIRFMISLSQT